MVFGCPRALDGRPLFTNITMSCELGFRQFETNSNVLRARLPRCEAGGAPYLFHASARIGFLSAIPTLATPTEIETTPSAVGTDSAPSLVRA